MAVVMHKRRLLERLRDRAPLTQWEEEFILPFRSKKMPTLPLTRDPPVDEVAPHKTYIVSEYSPGLRQWVNRPTFEERFSIWLPIDETFTCQRVTSAFAVAALEFSEAIEAMIDPPSLPVSPVSTSFSTSPPLAPDLGSSISASELLHPFDSPSSSPSPSSSVSASPRPSPQIMVSSPLRNHTGTSPSAVAPSEGNEPVATSPTSPTTKRGVRFAEDDKEDNIPIGYVMRIKKQKEEKARFLREQKERRQFEEERRKHEEERKQRERERAEWENERRVWEQEKRAVEEERKKRLYAEEYAASRQRAENSRHGMRSSSSSTSLHDRPERPNYDSRRYSRLPYDNAPQTPRTPGYETASSSPHTSSPSSSRPPSIAGPSSSAVHQNAGHSRPSSFCSAHTNSSEDVRTGARPSRERSHTAPGKTGSHTSLLLPPMPPLPVMFPTDMPLLPPTAPFMMNAYSSRPSQSRSSSSSSRRSSPRNGSVESVNTPTHPRSGSSPRANFSSHSQTPSSSSSTRAPTHHRRTSDDNVPRHSSNSSRTPSYSQLSLPRGRPPHPTYNTPVIPNPWTAMPTQMGMIPTVMPYYSNHDPRMATPRRQTTFS